MPRRGIIYPFGRFSIQASKNALVATSVVTIIASAHASHVPTRVFYYFKLSVDFALVATSVVTITAGHKKSPAGRSQRGKDQRAERMGSQTAAAARKAARPIRSQRIRRGMSFSMGA